MSRIERGQRHCAEAERLLGWCDTWLDELREHGRRARMDDVERVLFAALAAMAAGHDALASAANCQGSRAWCEALHRTQAEDPLLRFLWLARSAESPVVAWRAERAAAEARVVDANKLRHITSLFYSPLNPHAMTQRLLLYAHGAGTTGELAQKLRTAPVPEAARLEAAGMELSYALDALVLQDFDVAWNGRTDRVVVPRSHLGVKADFDAADTALATGLSFYRNKLAELAPGVGLV